VQLIKVDLHFGLEKCRRFLSNLMVVKVHEIITNLPTLTSAIADSSRHEKIIEYLATFQYQYRLSQQEIDCIIAALDHPDHRVVSMAIRIFGLFPVPDAKVVAKIFSTGQTWAIINFLIYITETEVEDWVFENHDIYAICTVALNSTNSTEFYAFTDLLSKAHKRMDLPLLLQQLENRERLVDVFLPAKYVIPQYWSEILELTFSTDRVLNRKGILLICNNFDSFSQTLPLNDFERVLIIKSNVENIASVISLLKVYVYYLFLDINHTVSTDLLSKQKELLLFISNILGFCTGKLLLNCNNECLDGTIGILRSLDANQQNRVKGNLFSNILNICNLIFQKIENQDICKYIYKAIIECAWQLKSSVLSKQLSECLLCLESSPCRDADQQIFYMLADLEHLSSCGLKALLGIVCKNSQQKFMELMIHILESENWPKIDDCLEYLHEALTTKIFVPSAREAENLLDLTQNLCSHLDYSIRKVAMACTQVLYYAY
jgi:hypothetical protein